MAEDAVQFFSCDGSFATYDKLHEHPYVHILGHLARMAEDGHKFTGLALWDESQPTDRVPPVSPVVRVFLVGEATKIRCTCCGRNTEQWEIGKAAFVKLMTQVFENGSRRKMLLR